MIVAGDGELMPFVRNLAMKYGNLEILGLVSDSKKFDLYRNALAKLFLPVDEPFGVTNIEAINEGCPVIAFNCGGPKIIIHEKNGYLCNSTEDYLDFVANFKNFDIDPKYFWELMHEKFSLEKMLNELSYHILVADS